MKVYTSPCKCILNMIVQFCTVKHTQKYPTGVVVQVKNNIEKGSGSLETILCNGEFTDEITSVMLPCSGDCN